MARDETPQYCYRIDSSDRISWVSRQWLEFAQENDAESLTEEVVLGRLLWDYVAGEETRHIYGQLFEAVRKGTEQVVPFRCDSPGVRRFMELRLSPLAAAHIQLEGRMLRRESRESEPVTLLDTTLPRTQTFVVMCGWCKRVRQPTGNWLELEHAIRVMHLFSTSPLPEISHGVCATCASTLTRQ